MNHALSARAAQFELFASGDLSAYVDDDTLGYPAQRGDTLTVYAVKDVRSPATQTRDPLVFEVTYVQRLTSTVVGEHGGLVVLAGPDVLHLRPMMEREGS